MRTLLHKFDMTMTAVIQGLPELVRPYMVGASIVGRPVITLSVAFLIAVGGVALENTSLLLAGAGAMVALGIGSMMKMTLRRKRPLSDYVMLMRFKSFSFPSGHSLGSVVSFGLFSYLVLFSMPAPWGWLVAVAMAFLCILIGVSRVYLGAHFPSDVLAGWVFAGVMLAVIIVSIQPKI